jgi:hypothetical protein
MTTVRNLAFVLLCVVVFGTSQSSARGGYCDVGGWHSSGAYIRDVSPFCDGVWYDGYWPDHPCEEAQDPGVFLNDVCPNGTGYWSCENDFGGPPENQYATANYVFRCVVN